ncbi:MAG: Fur family transcriptional regulator [Solirubrobacteraceae bacterium]
MPRAHSGPPVEAPDLSSALAALRARGLRVSAARRLVLEALYASDDPLTAERIAAGLDGRVPRSDPGSVYRNLETLESVGLVRHFHLGHGPGLYIRPSAGVREYLVCDSCGSVRAVEPAELDRVRALIRDEFGYVARFTHFPIAGLCPACAGGDLQAVTEKEPHAHP